MLLLQSLKHDMSNTVGVDRRTVSADTTNLLSDDAFCLPEVKNKSRANDALTCHCVRDYKG